MDISGVWYNEINSTVTFKVKGGALTGAYVSAVGKATGPYPLVGFVDTDDDTPTLGWVVRWQNEKKNSQSVTTWCGQAQVIDGEEIIDTTWLLVKSTSAKDNWESTMIGKDVFRRVMASAQDVQKAMLLKGFAKPESVAAVTPAPPAKHAPVSKAASKSQGSGKATASGKARGRHG